VSKSKGITSMKHARAWVDIIYPGALHIEAKPRIKWVPRGDKLQPMSVEEDIWGVFDLLAFPIRDFSRVHCLQITTVGKDGHSTSNVSVRRRKVQHWIDDCLPPEPPAWLGDIAVMAWVPRKHFRRWLWDWPARDWWETPTCLAPLPRKEPADPAPVQRPASDPCHPPF
jgi:hypothetical protein